MSDIAASVRAPSAQRRQGAGVDFEQMLVRFALERILYRLSQSTHADGFLLNCHGFGKRPESAGTV